MNEEIQGTPQAQACGCEGESCSHKEETKEAGLMTKHRGNDELAFALLLALTPLAVLTFFGQVGLL
jgi:hypothetical protein